MFHGFDNDTTMLRIGSMNMMLHGLSSADIAYKNSLAVSKDGEKEHTDEDKERYTLVLANPPFKGTLDNAQVNPELLKITKSKHTELLFLAWFLRCLAVGGRAVVIVPDGVTFSSHKDYLQIRKAIIDENRLDAVISMPSGVFEPYSGVATSILCFTKTGHGGTDHVWFYKMEADGYSLDKKRVETDYNRHFKWLKESEISVPDAETQKEIRERLDLLSIIIERQEEALEKYDELVKSRFIEMFGDPVTNPMGWKVKSLLELGDCKNGMNFHKGENGVDLHCLGVGDFQNLSVIPDTSVLPIVSLNEKPSKEYLLQDGDIVFVRSNGNKNLVGRCLAVYPHDTQTTFSGFCIRYRISNADEVLTEYLLQVLKHESMRQKMTGRGANIQNLNQQMLSALQIPLPPIDLQRQFIEFAELTDKSKLTIQKSLDHLAELRDSLLQEYFG